MTKPSLTDELRQLLPQELRDAPPVQRVAELEQAAARAQTEREFLERAPREGLLYPADALKLEDLHACLGKAPDRATGLNEYFAALRASRPWLFARTQVAPTQKLADHEPDPERLRRHMTHGALTRQLQAVRVRRR
ncbi:MAG: hypothetical protein HS108_13375 [Planctomycetes bacterium]|jgi:hypothetical protein|nr:hypothetical protein [Planctomycetota bacterium]MCL4729470.1 hypothetical protein [Planctomycetota bacterium]